MSLCLFDPTIPYYQASTCPILRIHKFIIVAAVTFPIQPSRDHGRLYDDLSFYDSTPYDSTWVYTPLNENERIVRIWKRAQVISSPWEQADYMTAAAAMRLLSEEDFARRNLAIVFQTNQGRMLLFGGQWSFNLPHCDWTLLDAPDGKPGHFFFDTHPTCTRALSFETQAPRTEGPVFDLPGVPEAFSPHPPFQSAGGFVWSSASVEKVERVTPCRLKGKIVGLLFSYLDGRSAAVGEIRLDHLDAPLKRVDGGKLCLSFTRDTEKCPYIARVEMLTAKTDTPVKDKQENVEEWFEVSWSGKIEWWHNHRQCQIWQDGRQSLDIAILPRVLSPIDDQIATFALDPLTKPALIARNIKLAQINLVIMEDWIKRHAIIFSWVKPQTGTTAFIKLERDGNPIYAEWLC
ncbi:hypothetical protein CEP54_007322 [Fusarium duplospermum]|uniref:Uncharacterized protein n=1 Tax=Fusarium duplospermum TaxID=1325734 RepID=A0A428Q282_9HYPO|nr:hypothetical protein CEP54_007322 [Fusarium duplospermum]